MPQVQFKTEQSGKISTISIVSELQKVVINKVTG